MSERNIFHAGDRTLLIDGKGRNYLITLQAGGAFHFHRGIVQHDDVIGRHDGCRLISTGGEPVFALRPSYSEFVLKMSRGAQVVYPKDAAMIVSQADIHPGAVVLEAGTGSGALAIALARAVGTDGRVISYEIREDFAEIARSNIESFLGKAENVELRIGDLYEAALDVEFDRVVLDLPEPWRAIPQMERCLRSGGRFVSYLPTTLQVHELAMALAASPGWTSVLTTETLVRTWHVEKTSVRPDHRMVGHTAFLVSARRVEV